MAATLAVSYVLETLLPLFFSFALAQLVHRQRIMRQTWAKGRESRQILHQPGNR